MHSLNVLDCLKQCPSVKTSFHSGARHIPVALDCRLPLLEEILDLPTARRSSDTHDRTLVELLVEIVLLETVDFIEDIKRTDEAMNSRQEGELVGSEGLSRRVYDVTASPPPSQKSSDEERESDALPVAALIVASYASLLLHTVVSGTFPTHSGSMECVPLIARLPRGSWWLCIRILKAFLALQGQVVSLRCIMLPYGRRCSHVVKYIPRLE